MVSIPLKGNKSRRGGKTQQQELDEGDCGFAALTHCAAKHPRATGFIFLLQSLVLIILVPGLSLRFRSHPPLPLPPPTTFASATTATTTSDLHCEWKASLESSWQAIQPSCPLTHKWAMNSEFLTLRNFVCYDSCSVNSSSKGCSEPTLTMMCNGVSEYEYLGAVAAALETQNVKLMFVGDSHWQNMAGDALCLQEEMGFFEEIELPSKQALSRHVHYSFTSGWVEYRRSSYLGLNTRSSLADPDAQFFFQELNKATWSGTIDPDDTSWISDAISFRNNLTAVFFGAGSHFNPGGIATLNNEHSNRAFQTAIDHLADEVIPALHSNGVHVFFGELHRLGCEPVDKNISEGKSWYMWDASPPRNEYARQRLSPLGVHIVPLWNLSLGRHGSHGKSRATTDSTDCAHWCILERHSVNRYAILSVLKTLLEL